MFGFGIGEFLLVFSIVCLLFGKRIPAAMRTMGSSIGDSFRSFQQGLQPGQQGLQSGIERLDPPQRLP